MRIHTIPVDKQRNIIYFPDSINFFVVNDSTAKLARHIADGEEYEVVKGEFPDLSAETYNAFKSKLTFTNSSTTANVSSRQLDRLIINISNDCNMRCKYCYANCGVYGGPKSLISSETLDKTLKLFYSLFDAIGIIQLFGGEPTLNIEAIETACQYLKSHNCQTHIGIVTNASLINEKLIKIVNEFDLNVTVSVDVEKVHDLLRSFPNNQPSWEIIKNNIHLLQDNTRQPTQIELTYTKVHEDENISIVDILHELQQEYGNIPVHVTPVCSENTQYHLPNRRAFIDSVHDIFEANKRGEKLNYSWLKSYELFLKHRQKFDYFCGACISTLSVSTTGEIYPCFYFIDKPEYKIANVKDDAESVEDSIKQARKQYFSSAKYNLKKCKNCFANTLCRGCLGANLDEMNDPFIASDEQCEMTKKMIENILKELAVYSKNKGN